MALFGVDPSFVDYLDDETRAFLHEDPALSLFGAEYQSLEYDSFLIPRSSEEMTTLIPPTVCLPSMPLAPTVQIKQEAPEIEEPSIHDESISDGEFAPLQPKMKKAKNNNRNRAYKLDESASVENQIKTLKAWIIEFQDKHEKVCLDPDLLKNGDEQEIKKERERVRKQKNAISAQLSRWRKKLDHLTTQETESLLEIENIELKKKLRHIEEENTLLIIQNRDQASEIQVLKRELEIYRQELARDESVDIRVSGSPRKGFLVQYHRQQTATDSQAKTVGEKPSFRSHQDYFGAKFG
ncbi:MAG: hypothetical protein HYX61_07310 [Gammaproteobacteria bacterium]|jgi:hypothetical protein|nr:hypothetical protein [Gammaproteobacteria bacterium]